MGSLRAKPAAEVEGNELRVDPWARPEAHFSFVAPIHQSRGKKAGARNTQAGVACWFGFGSICLASGVGGLVLEVIVRCFAFGTLFLWKL